MRSKQSILGLLFAYYACFGVVGSSLLNLLNFLMTLGFFVGLIG